MKQREQFAGIGIWERITRDELLDWSQSKILVNLLMILIWSFPPVLRRICSNLAELRLNRCTVDKQIYYRFAIAF